MCSVFKVEAVLEDEAIIDQSKSRSIQESISGGCDFVIQRQLSLHSLVDLIACQIAQWCSDLITEGTDSSLTHRAFFNSSTNLDEFVRFDGWDS